MNVFRNFILVAALFFTLSWTTCRAQQANPQKELSFEEIIAKQVEDMVDRYKLDDYQAFKLDTLLQHFAPIYNAEMKRAKDSGAAQSTSFQSITDKWADFFDNEYQKIFTEEQWNRYLKSSAGREKKKRDKRMAALKEESAEE